MATPREYFDKDSSDNMGMHTTLTIQNSQTGVVSELIAGISWDFNAGVKYCRLFVPDYPKAAELISTCLNDPDMLVKVGDGVELISGFHGTSEAIKSKDMPFSKRVNVYTAAVISPDHQNQLHAFAAQKGLTLLLRDAVYLGQRAAMEKPLAFISHDSRDKDAFVRKLAGTLQQMVCPVWYDEFSLIAGQSLRASIERGLKECKKCVLVLSPNFFGNGGWTKAEFDSVFTREILEQKDVIIPIWLGVTKQQVYDYSPRLLDKVGIQGTLGMDEIAKRILRAINYNE